jgi:hypothetical protein
MLDNSSLYLFNFYTAFMLKLKLTCDIAEMYTVCREKYLAQESTWSKHVYMILEADISV